MSVSRRQAAGFTLVELIVSIVIAAIVAGFIVLFLAAPIQDYFAQTRRTDLVDSGSRIAAAVTNDVRTALPNSLRKATSGSTQALEFLATQGVARYYTGTDSPGPDMTVGSPTTVGTPVTSFATLDSFTTQAPPYSANYLSVGNVGVAPTYDAYSSGNAVMTPGSVQIATGANPGENLVTLSAPMTFQAPTAPTAHNAYLVTGPVSYVCNPTAGTFMRYSGYAITAVPRVAPGGSGALIAHDVSACNLTLVPAPGAYPYGELAIFTVTLASGGESLQVFVEAPTEYAQ